jgi:hypothetical protein
MQCFPFQASHLHRTNDDGNDGGDDVLVEHGGNDVLVEVVEDSP